VEKLIDFGIDFGRSNLRNCLQHPYKSKTRL